ncbi:hypothetical protein [Marinomonas algicola]|uniref:hypothetical protein n=1 Tax=Marinomonas algicola TaxID=2773454 RepID=UPI00174A874C|nr:hypothetical protein [Marinomonas algicola]
MLFNIGENSALYAIFLINMYMLAEPNLVEFAERLNKAIPGTYNYQKTEELLNSIDTPSSTNDGNQGFYIDSVLQPEMDWTS